MGIYFLVGYFPGGKCLEPFYLHWLITRKSDKFNNVDFLSFYHLFFKIVDSFWVYLWSPNQTNYFCWKNWQKMSQITHCCQTRGLKKNWDKLQLAIKLHAVKLEEKPLLWILDFLNLWSQCVQLFDDSGNHVLSSSTHVLSGLPQGSVLGHTLLNTSSTMLFPLPAVNQLSMLTTWTFLDQPCPVKIITFYKIILVRLINELRKGFLNLILSSAISFTLRKISPCRSYCLSGHPLSSVNTEQDLGITIDNELKFSIHAKKSAADSNSTMGLIKRTFPLIPQSHPSSL